MVPNTATAPHTPAVGLAGTKIRRTAFPRQRAQLPVRTQSSTPTLVAAGPSSPPPQRSTVYPVTICWEPSQDQTPSEHPYDILSFRSSYPPEAQLVEENTPEPPVATTNDKREISDVTTHSEHEEQDGRERHAATADVTTRSEHEEQDERERPAATANHRRGISDVMPRSEREEQHEQARPAARRGGKRVGASELEGLGIGGGEEAKGISEGRVTRTRKIRAPRAPGDELQ